MMQTQSNIRLPRLISDGMVLQRNEQIKLWGWAPAGELLTVRFMGREIQTLVDANGEWKLVLPAREAGGPYDLIIEIYDGDDQIVIRNILFGDVWLCSGQSNMDMKMVNVMDTYPKEIDQASNSNIRQFLVPVRYDFEQIHTDFEAGSWEEVNPESILNFTAVGYFFAIDLYEKYKIPIGLLNASLGGAPAEAWLSEEALLKFPDYLESAISWRDKNKIETTLKENETTMQDWYQKLNTLDVGLTDGNIPCYDMGYDASGWSFIQVPTFWEEEGLGNFNGAVWFRKEIDLPSELSGFSAKMLFGNILDEDTVYMNGIKVGTTPMQYIPRKYEVMEGILKAGKNTIVVRVVSQSGKGGFIKEKPYQLQIGDYRIDLEGEWQYKIGVKLEPMPAATFVMWKPSGLYNGMIAPLIPFTIKGAIWYQGESNTGKPAEYESLLKELITDWRKKWNIGDFAFLYVQLPNFTEAVKYPAESSWAELREGQRRTLSLPGTGMAVALDLGEWNDIHPVNKKDVGHRLALVAQKTAYGDTKVVSTGPLFQSAKREGNRIILFFSETGNGLITKDGDKPRHFAIAGRNSDYLWADAEVKQDMVIIWNDQISDPIYVRYAWADNPEGANLYNLEGLPASPFSVEIIPE